MAIDFTPQIDFEPEQVESNPNLTEAVKTGMTEGLKAALPSENAFDPIKPDSPNPVIGGAQAALQTLRDPTRISPTVSQPGQVAGNKAEDAVKAVGAGEFTQKATNFLVSSLLDPQTYMMGEGASKAAKEVTPALGKQATKLQEVLSGVDAENFQKLFSDPAAVLKAPSSKVTGKAFQAAKEAAGLTTEEERKLAINEGARKRIYSKVMSAIDNMKPLERGEQLAIKGSDTLPDQTLTHIGPMLADSPESLRASGVSESTIKEMSQPMYNISEAIGEHPAKSSLTHDTLTKLGYDMPERGSSNTPSAADLLRAKKAGQLIAESNPSSSGLIQKEIHDKINPLLKVMAPDVYNTQQAVHLSKVKESLLNIFPQGKGMMNYFRTISMLGGSMFHGIGALESPVVQTGLTLGVKGASKLARSAPGTIALGASLNEASKSALQSVLARLHNNQNINFKDSKYGNQ